MKHGFGKLTRPNGTCYEGDWFKDCEKGMGHEIYQDGSIYVGTFLDGFKEGFGS